MAAELTERIVILITPEQKAQAAVKAQELGGMGALVREALTLFLAQVQQHETVRQEAA